ncbi:carbohydrate ABC transporter permease [Mesorhizobium sp. M2D.F.Ca.ET.185.01.1.1]|uniref:carbohydrate ABC transporter permease n=1 Tax=unclassified Mesorhizobium TaxID=325217 RepID=UPI000FCC1F65|nr:MULTISPECIES: carbohydrate ABC transporter permease [unclassified Mesorhizobium]TGP77395.1 carbohydrate ABC transporter permease [bacterium M00.F.Ca.ET.227.01.1.1]TGP93190.1 carbohydrate ABC transporter permease [bacterium M00.F.Ca.ET.222.01.1.1]TGP96736.1 carbohydrate ABC transporter permease [bacterium M00.F.Ca.ET.221.01.1.1]TGT95014.1 carbohydrate ABC transporter permease [bacterium M00.F.Ca.ET.163.01.1.1]TGU21153.1 carbohydrate ABC transporter permease [bacterium M00.F.Ca.ET.156.01.1.1]
MTHDSIVLERGGRYHLRRVFIYCCLIFIAGVYLLPLVVVVFTSLKNIDEIRNGSLLSLPKAPTLEAWQQAWSDACIGLQCSGLKGFFLNSMILIVPAVGLSTAIGAINGFALTHWKFRGSNVIFALLLFGVFIPFQIILIPMARSLGAVGLANTMPGLILVHVVYGIPFTTLFFRNYFVSLPAELVKAAKVDGAGFYQTFFRVILPISMPCIVVAVIWQFTNIWNDFLFGTTFTSGDNVPVTVALNNIVNTTTGVKRYNVDMAAVVLTALPTIAIYVLAGKYFLRGLMAGSVKG